MLVKVAGRRWTIEERFQTGKGLVGSDQHQVRRWRSWYRWATLAMLAHAFLVVATLAERTHHPAPPGLIGLTRNELQHLFAALVAQPVGDLGHRLRWSLWRRRHQARARACHYRRQASRPYEVRISATLPAAMLNQMRLSPGRVGARLREKQGPYGRRGSGPMGLPCRPALVSRPEVRLGAARPERHGLGGNTVLLAAGERVLEAVLLGVLGLPLSIAVLVWTKGRS